MNQLLAVDQTFNFAFKVTDVEFGAVTEAESAAVSSYDAIAFDPVKWHDRAAMQSMAINDLINVIVYVSFFVMDDVALQVKSYVRKVGRSGKGGGIFYAAVLLDPQTHQPAGTMTVTELYLGKQAKTATLRKKLIWVLLG